MDVLIGGAWPYANGPLLLGHIASLLPGDVLARWHRAVGNRVCYVSGSDCHGTPVSIRAQQEGRSPAEVSNDWHRAFVRTFETYGFSYDRYGQTSEPAHLSFVTEFHRALYADGHVDERTVRQAWCPQCNRFLPDRYVKGLCPSCGAPARGDQCEACGTVTEPETLLVPVCAICGTVPEVRETKQLFLLLSHFQETLERWLESHPEWRRNAWESTARYLREGLRDRAITRDLDWGIPVPRDGYEGKCIYIWAENVLGYLSGCAAWCADKDIPFREFWNGAFSHYVHGKDNIPFHTVILPGLLLGEGSCAWRLPDAILSSEYLTLEGRKISTSAGWSIDADELAAEAPVDAIRYQLLANGPEKRDADFSREDFLRRYHSEVIGIYGNLVNRTLAFLVKYQDGCVPGGDISQDIRFQVAQAYHEAGEQIRTGAFKAALEGALGLFRLGNRTFDAGKPWVTRHEDAEVCRSTLRTCVYLIANGCRLMHPFLPDSTVTVLDWLGMEAGWLPVDVPAGRSLEGVRPLFPRLDAR